MRIVYRRGFDSVCGFGRLNRIRFQDVGYPTVQPTKLFLEFIDLGVVRFCSHVARQFIQIIQGEPIEGPFRRQRLASDASLDLQGPLGHYLAFAGAKIRRTEVRPIWTRRAISDLLTPAI